MKLGAVVTGPLGPLTFSTPHWLVTEPAEFVLVKKLAQFGEVLPTILDDHRPNLLCNYLFELANAYHSFYEACPVLKAEEPARSSRLILSDTTARVLAKGLELLGISVEAQEKVLRGCASSSAIPWRLSRTD